VSAWNQRSLTAAIAEQERAVEEADQRLSSRLAKVKSTLRNKRSPLRSAVLSVGSVAAAWFFLRGRRGRIALQTRAGSGDRLSGLLNAALPLLAPVVGVRVATVLSALAAVQTTAAARAPVLAQAIDLARYAGTWSEIARLPTRYERQCAGDVTTTYLSTGTTST
jgi:apolipoprotein D and lipocalin family protein